MLAQESVLDSSQVPAPYALSNVAQEIRQGKQQSPANYIRMDLVDGERNGG